MDNSLIDGKAIMAKMYTESVLNELDKIQDVLIEQTKLANVKGDNQLSDFLQQQVKRITIYENKLDDLKTYLDNLVGLSSGLYGGDIGMKTIEPGDE
jgi:hypothetical protein